jgi:curved DNA-binding protein CbpA
MADPGAVPFDPYAVLGVSALASADEIHSAYRAIARRLHPDVNPGDPSAAAAFARATQAFELLSDDAWRRAYELRRSADHGPRAVRTAPRPTGNVQVRGPGAVPAHRARSGEAPSPREERDPLAAIGTLAKFTAIAVVLLLVAIAIVALTSPPPCGPGVEGPCREAESPSPYEGG